MGRLRWTPELREHLRQRRMAGESVKAIAEEYGVTPGRISQVAELSDVEMAILREGIPIKQHNARVRKRVRAAYHEMRDDFIAWARTV